jgi:hypothetical protein
MEILYVLAGLITLDIASLLWGADSRDGVYSPEWQRRGSWRGFGSLTK